jgi:hypothetical protein
MVKIKKSQKDIMKNKLFFILLTCSCFLLIGAIKISHPNFFKLHKEFSKIQQKSTSPTTHKKIQEVETSIISTYENQESPSHLKKQMRKYKILGTSVVVIQDGEMLWEKCYGRSSKKKPLTINSNFTSPLLYKPLLAITALYYANKASIHLQDDLDKLFSQKKTKGQPKKDLDSFLKTEKQYDKFGILKIDKDYLKKNQNQLIAFIEKLSEESILNTLQKTIVEKFYLSNSLFEKENIFSTTGSDLASILIHIQNSKIDKTNAIFPQDTIENIFSFAKNKTEDKNFFGINCVDKNFSCLAIMHVEKGYGAVILTNSKKGNLLASEILTSIAKVYNWPNFDSKKQKTFQIVENSKKE